MSILFTDEVIKIFASLNSLEESEKEGAIISELFKENATIYKREEASAKNLFNLQKVPKILHISTHGIYLNNKDIQDSYLKSIIYLSGSNEARKEHIYTGFILASKLLSLNLDDCELVFFSVCQSGLGDIRDSEGVDGVQKAVLQAGAKRVVSTLWEVNADKTALFVKYFINF